MSNIAKSLEADFAANATNESLRLADIATEYEIVKSADWPDRAGDTLQAAHAAGAELIDPYVNHVIASSALWTDREAMKHTSPSCRWCRSRAADDARGNCGACGGPR